VLIPGLGSGCQRQAREGECVASHPVLAECEIDKEQEERGVSSSFAFGQCRDWYH